MSPVSSVSDSAQPDNVTAYAEPRIFALIVGIDEWRSKDIPALAGCVNDALAMQRFLTDKLLVPDSHIKLLLNESATRQAILDNFDSHLINNPKINDPAIKPGDAIIFYYAGHGSRVSTPEGWPHIEGWTRNDGFIETICPYDERTYDANGRFTHGIPDLTFKILLLRLAASKGNNITVISDSCHSGGIVRVPLLVDKNDGLARSVETKVPIPPNLDVDIWKPVRAGHATLSPEFKHDPRSSSVLLAACRQEEVAFETKSSEGRPRGFFTYNLINLLEEHKAKNTLHRISYVDLLDELNGLSIQHIQHPQCEGTNKRRTLFSGLAPASNVLRAIDRGGRRFEVSIGSIHGVIRGAEFTLGSPYSGVVLSADSVNIDSSILVLHDDDEGQSPTILSEATVLSWTIVPALKVSLDGLPKSTVEVIFPTPGPSSSSHYSPTQSKRKYAQVSSRKADVWVIQDANKPNGVIVRTRNTLLPRAKEKFEHTLSDVALLPSVLNAVADFNFYLGYHNGATEVTMELYRLSRAGPFSPELPDERFGNFLVGNQATLTQEAGTVYGISIVNRSTVSLFPYLFYFDPADCSIQTWYAPPSPTMSAPLPAPRNGTPMSIRIGYGSIGECPFEFIVPEGKESDTGYLKLVLSTKYVDLHEWVAQPSPFKVEDNVDNRSGQQMNRSEIDVWDALVASITVVTEAHSKNRPLGWLNHIISKSKKV